MGFFASSGILNRRGFFGGTTAAPFSPSDISGLQLWLDATTGLFDATSGGSAVTTDGSAVARWEDQSGNGRHATQGTSNNRPVLKTAIKNGKNVLRFDGSNDLFSLASTIGGSAFTFITAWKNSDAVTGSMLIWSTGNPYARYVGIVTDSSYNADGRDKFTLSQNDNGSGNSGSLAFSGGSAGSNFIIGSCVNTGSAGTAWLNNQSGVNVGTISGSFTFNLIGGYGFGYELHGDVCEIIAYNSALSDSNRLLVEGYLNTKWSVY